MRRTVKSPRRSHAAQVRGWIGWRIASYLWPIALLAACSTEQKWSSGDVGLRPDLLAREISPELARNTRVEDIPVIPPPNRLRPCCAFGDDLRVSLLSTPVPGFAMSNIIGVDSIGPHNYDNGAVAFEASRPGATAYTNEHNGLAYTCRGGFIDTAHVRDWADWTLFLATLIGRHLEHGTSLELSAEGGLRRIRIQPVPADELLKHERREIAVPLAQWLAFQMSVWHEIATWYGWSALSMFPEEASAFSPEDLYSNLLGIKLSGALIYQYTVTSEASYNENLQMALRSVLERLGGLSLDQARHAIRAVDGEWWDSRVALPAKGLVRRRNFEIGSVVTPWLVQDTPRSSDDMAAITALCGSVAPVPLRNPQTCVTGHAFEEYAELEIDVDEALAQRGFPFPRRDSRRITQRDFPDIITQIRAQDATEIAAHSIGSP